MKKLLDNAKAGEDAVPALSIEEINQVQSPPDLSQAIDWTKVDIGAMNHEAQTELFRRSRESFANDPYRPLYHFSPSFSGLHDPSGLCWWQGKYHLFYLKTDLPINAARGHAVSDDLVHWKDLPLLPLSIHGCTGQIWIDSNRAIMSYGQGDGVHLATASDPLLLNWVEHPSNPVNKLKQSNMPTDSYLWRENGIYYLTLRKHHYSPGLQYIDGKTSMELFCSKDLEAWESSGILFEDGYFTERGDDSACPNFLPIGGGKHLLLFFSHKRSAQYYIGTFDQGKGRFEIENHGRMNYGPVKRGSLHAPSAFIDQKGRCIAIWNIFENRKQEGWAEVLSLPRHISLNADTTGKDNFLKPLLIEPIEELKSLRFDPISIDPVTIPANSEKVLSGVNGRAMELEVVIDPLKAREVGLNILRSPDGREQTTITLYMQGWSRNENMRELAIDVSRASLDSKVDSRSPEIGPLYLEKGEPLRLRVFIDRSVVEVFANGRQCLTLRSYPSLHESEGVSVFARGGDAKLVSLTAYQMRSIWPELKTLENFSC